MVAVRSEDSDGGETIVGPAISIRGQISGEEDLRVEGRVEGSISLTETLYVEPNGVVLAEVDARDVVVSGIVIGNITATNSVTLNNVAKLVGNIHAPRVIIAEGASFRGDVTMGGEVPTPRERDRSRAIGTVPRGNVSTARATRSRAGAPARREVAAAPARPAAAPAARKRRSGKDDDDTVVIKQHSALRKGEAPPEEEEREKAPRRRAKKSARMPARGRRKAGKRSGS